MRLDDLADAARLSGLRVVEVEGWQERGHGDFRAVESVMCHHTAGSAEGNLPSLDVLIDGRPGLAGPLCNLALARNGAVYVIAAGVAYHAGEVEHAWQNNWHSIGIEAEHTGTTAVWTEVQYDAYVRLVAALCVAYGLRAGAVVGHKEAAPTRKIDPTFAMGKFRTDVEAEMEIELSDDTIERIVDRLLARGVPSDITPHESGQRSVSGMLTSIERGVYREEK